MATAVHKKKRKVKSQSVTCLHGNTTCSCSLISHFNVCNIFFYFICSALCLFQLHAVVLICGGVGDKTVFCIYDGNKLL